jgi:hypothetical protein
MRRLSLFFALAVAGCFSPKYGNGHLKCAPSQSCPDGYHCAADDTCWKNGSDPEIDMGPAGDDLAPPPPVTYPPASVWISCGGGAVVAASGAELATSMCELSVAGTAMGTASGVVTFGYFSDDSF